MAWQLHLLTMDPRKVQTPTVSSGRGRSNAALMLTVNLSGMALEDDVITQQGGSRMSLSLDEKEGLAEKKSRKERRGRTMAIFVVISSGKSSKNMLKTG